MSDLDHLLDLQANDTHADQLRHRRETLPETGPTGRARPSGEASIEASVPSSPRRPTRRPRPRAEAARGRGRHRRGEGRATVDRQLYGGGVTSPRRPRPCRPTSSRSSAVRDQLEDQVLEMMEQIEPLERAGSTASAGPWPTIGPSGPRCVGRWSRPSVSSTPRSPRSRPPARDWSTGSPPSWWRSTNASASSIRWCRRRPPLGLHLPGLSPHPRPGRGRRDPPPARRRGAALP